MELPTCSARTFVSELMNWYESPILITEKLWKLLPLNGLNACPHLIKLRAWHEIQCEPHTQFRSFLRIPITYSDYSPSPLLLIWSLRSDDGDGNENGKKAKRFRLAKQQLCTLFCTFLCRRCTTTTWNCLISRFVEDGNRRQQLSFSFHELWYSPLEFNSTKICQHLTN